MHPSAAPLVSTPSYNKAAEHDRSSPTHNSSYCLQANGYLNSSICLENFKAGRASMVARRNGDIVVLVGSSRSKTSGRSQRRRQQRSLRRRYDLFLCTSHRPLSFIYAVNNIYVAIHTDHLSESAFPLARETEHHPEGLAEGGGGKHSKQCTTRSCRRLSLLKHTCQRWLDTHIPTIRNLAASVANSTEDRRSGESFFRKEKIKDLSCPRCATSHA